MEITEDAEETGGKEETSKTVPSPQSEARGRAVSIRSEATLVPPTEPPVEPELPPTSPESEKASVDLRPPPSRASSRAPTSPSESQSGAMFPRSRDSNRSSSKSRYRNILDEFPRPSEEIRMSTQSARPSLQELERLAGFTPKVKLGPRPSVDSSGRPRTSGSSRNPDQRPVASLPMNMRSSSVRKATDDTPRPRSQGSTFATKPTSRVPPVPPLLVPPLSIPISRPQLSPGAKSLGALSTSSGLTPEKERLMKALQQRRKNMAKRAEETNKKKVDEKQGLRPQNYTHMADDDKENIIIQGPEPESKVVRRNHYEIPSVASGALNDSGLRSTSKPVPEPESAPAPASSPEVAQAVVEPVVQPVAEPVAEPVVEPVVESVVESVAEPILDSTPESAANLEQLQVPESLEPPQPEPVADTSSAIPEGRSSSKTDLIVDPISSTGDAAESSDPVRTESPQPVIEDETRIELKGPVIPDLAPPQLDHEALQTEPLDAPQSNSGDLSGTHLESRPVVEERVDSTESTEAADSILQPATPSVTPPESTTTETPTVPVSASVYPSPAAESTPDHSPAVDSEPKTLDKRRKVHLEPIQVPTPEYSDDDNLLSDDSFMEELTSATVQEARPVSVKSPHGNDHVWKNSRAVSSPYYSIGSPSTMQTFAVGRSVSSPYFENGPPTPVLMAKKINVSSGISSRIKALEKFSSRDGTPMSASPAPSGPSASSSFENLRKRSSISSPGESQELTPPGTMQSANNPDSSNRHDRQTSVDAMRGTNSVSVTAHIVRNADASPGSSGLEPSGSEVLNLQASPLTVEHEPVKKRPETTNPKATRQPNDRSLSMSSNGSSRPSTSRPGSRLSLSSRSRTDDATNPPPPPTVEEKKGSRTSRLMRRMSSITATSRRSIIGALSSPVKEEEHSLPIASRSVDGLGSTGSRSSEAIHIGEVNVQFPETLLWKRRVMRIDEKGYVVLAPGTNDASSRSMTKRYHLTEFRTPCLPDEDMQELPNSILLDFLDGNTLQCACESRQGQASALHGKFSMPNRETNR